MLILKIVGISKMIFLSNLTKEYCSVVCSKIVDSSRENLYDHIYSGESTELFKFRKVSVEEQRKGNCITLLKYSRSVYTEFWWLPTGWVTFNTL